NWELQEKLLEDQMILQKRVEKAEWEVGELKYTLEVEGRTKADLKSQLEELQYCLLVDERSKTVIGGSEYPAEGFRKSSTHFE
ncbi:hypothetical protein BC833DRAFT_610575, partial [Globomyces pollinis-pini]